MDVRYADGIPSQYATDRDRRIRTSIANGKEEKDIVDGIEHQPITSP